MARIRALLSGPTGIPDPLWECETCGQGVWRDEDVILHRIFTYCKCVIATGLNNSTHKPLPTMPVGFTIVKGQREEPYVPTLPPSPTPKIIVVQSEDPNDHSWAAPILPSVDDPEDEFDTPVGFSHYQRRNMKTFNGSLDTMHIHMTFKSKDGKPDPQLDTRRDIFWCAMRELDTDSPVNPMGKKGDTIQRCKKCNGILFKACVLEAKQFKALAGQCGLDLKIHSFKKDKKCKDAPVEIVEVERVWV